MSTQKEMTLSGDDQAEARALSTETVRGPRPVADLRQGAMSLSVPEMQTALVEFAARHKNFRDWLLAQLKEGLHYGYPPGCEPEIDERGWFGVKSRGGVTFYPPEQWTAKKSLYAAGADFLCELCGLRDTYEADLAAWEQAGKPEHTFIFICRLLARSDGQIMGEGRGASKTADEQTGINGAVKKAQKRAKVAAVLATYGLRDLFTQDMEILPPPKHDNPATDKNAPKTAPRAERRTAIGEEVRQLVIYWKDWQVMNTREPDPKRWAEWACKAIGVTFDVKKPEQWKPEYITRCRDALTKEGWSLA